MLIYNNVNSNSLYKEEYKHDKIDSQWCDTEQTTTTQQQQHIQEQESEKQKKTHTIKTKQIKKPTASETNTSLLTRANTNFLRSLGYRVRQYR